MRDATLTMAAPWTEADAAEADRLRRMIAAREGITGYSSNVTLMRARLAAIEVDHRPIAVTALQGAPVDTLPTDVAT